MKVLQFYVLDPMMGGVLLGTEMPFRHFLQAPHFDETANFSNYVALTFVLIIIVDLADSNQWEPWHNLNIGYIEIFSARLISSPSLNPALCSFRTCREALCQVKHTWYLVIFNSSSSHLKPHEPSHYF